MPNAFVESARSRIGAPFRHHYRPENLCNSGKITLQSCMERGLDDDDGYDYSGLVIASITDVLNIAISDWPLSRRHPAQLKDLTCNVDPRPGDVQLLITPATSQKRELTQLGIYVSENVLIRTADMECVKEVETVPASHQTTFVIPAVTIINMVEQERRA